MNEDAQDVQAALAPAAFTLRFTQEIERSTRYARPVTVGVVLIRPSVELRAAQETLKALRRCDIVGQLGQGVVGFLLPEVIDTAEIPARRLIQGLRGRDPEARVGLAICPADGTTTEALLGAAMQAAEGAAPGDVGWAGGDGVHLDIGGRTVLAVDPRMRRVFREVRMVAPTRMPVLITGETGCGKEAVARAVHYWSERAHGPWEVFNFAALPDQLAESKLFGYVPGAFTGAIGSRAGLFEVASGGTLFIDEFTEASPEAQAKLLRVLQEGEVSRLGSNDVRKVDVRVVAATNRDPMEAIRAGRLRADLYYRLETVRIDVPALRERPLDIPALARWFLRSLRRPGLPPLRLEAQVEHILGTQQWPGNVRELRNRMEFLAQTVQGDRITEAHLRDRNTPTGPLPNLSAAADGPQTFQPLKAEIEALTIQRMREALDHCNGNRTQAAALLSLSRRTFHDYLKRYGLADRS